MKYIILITSVLSLLSCKQGLSQKDKPAKTQNKTFWEQRSIINKNNLYMEYPFKKDTAIMESRTNKIYLNNWKSQFELFIDDVLLLKVVGEITENGGGITGGYDINQLILTSGTHEVKLRLYPQYGLNVFQKDVGGINLIFEYFKDRDLRTLVYNENMGGENGILIDQDSFNYISNKPKIPDNFFGLPVYEWRKTFDVQVPFSYDAWRNSINLKKEQDEDKKDIKAELLAAYKNIYQIIAKKDTVAYLNLVNERENLITSTLYYKENEKKIRANEFIKLFENPDYELEPLVEEAMQIDYQGYGKLVMFLNKADAEGAIRLKNKKNSNENVYMDFRFQRKKKGDKLTII